jgi:heme-degrading monooxygenase HmoA
MSMVLSVCDLCCRPKQRSIVSCGSMAGMNESANSQPDYIYVWDYIVSKSSVLEFEDCYGPNGEWVKLFRKSTGYLGTQLIKDKVEPLRYLTIDHWRSEKDYKEFLGKFRSEYDELDRRFEELTVKETKMGAFTTIS